MADAEISSGSHRGSVFFGGNTWTEEFIQSLNSPYSNRQYSNELACTVEEIKDILKAHLSFPSHQSLNKESNLDVFQCLQLVDALQSLAVQEHFTEEIEHGIEYVHRFWDESKGISFGSEENEHTNLLCTCLAFRLLRMYRYPVTPSPIEPYFVTTKMMPQDVKLADKQEIQVKSILQLFRASGLYFPQETTLQEAEDFSSHYLKSWLQHYEKLQEEESSQNSLFKEVKHVLSYPWYCNPPLWNARNYIEIYQLNHDWLRSTLNQKILKLARLNINIKQAVYQEEMKEIFRWWNKHSPKLRFMRLRPMESYFYAVLHVPEFEYRDARLALAKSCILAYALDDTSDNYATFTEFKQFYEILEQGDLSKVEMESYHPEEIKDVLKFTMATINEILLEANQKQGRDMKSDIKKAWLKLVRAYLQESEWNETKYIPSFEEYINKNASSAATSLLAVNALLFMDTQFELNTYSHVLNLVDILIRAYDDYGDFKDPKKQDQLVNLVQCYLHHNHHASLEEGLKYMKRFILKKWQEINSWYFKENNRPSRSMTFCYDICRVTTFFLVELDGFTFSDTKIKQQMMKIFLEPA